MPFLWSLDSYTGPVWSLRCPLHFKPRKKGPRTYLKPENRGFCIEINVWYRCIWESRVLWRPVPAVTMIPWPILATTLQALQCGVQRAAVIWVTGGSVNLLLSTHNALVVIPVSLDHGIAIAVHLPSRWLPLDLPRVNQHMFPIFI